MNTTEITSPEAFPEDEEKILISYKGPFLEQVLVLIGERINIILNHDPRLNKKIFSIFIELSQNIAYYSEERHREASYSEKTYGKGIFMILEYPTHYTMISSNLIKKSWEEEILSKSELINQLDLEGLRKLKRDLRRQPRKEGQLGGSIGLVDIALKAGTCLNVEIINVDDQYSRFALSVDLLKETQEPVLA